MIFDKRTLIKRQGLIMIGAPAIVRYAAIMPIKRLPKEEIKILIAHFNTLDEVVDLNKTFDSLYPQHQEYIRKLITKLLGIPEAQPLLFGESVRLAS